MELIRSTTAQGPRSRALSLMAMQLSFGLGQDRVDSLADELLLGLGQSAELFQLLVQLGAGPRLSRLPLLVAPTGSHTAD